MTDFRQTTRAAIMLLALTGVSSAQVATGGAFQLEQTVVASGGGVSSDASGIVYKVEGTTGQALAGTHSGNAAFSIKSGFWTPQPFAPTAAVVSLGGRVTTANGRGIRSVLIKLTGLNGETRTISTGAFGYYRFEDIPAGETYILSVSAKRFTFAENTQVHSVLEQMNDINFVANK